ncbi:aconitase iron-sulfur domain-containing protein [Wolfiporia cocos MD-104 SS10]|uniref:Aconitase iron-sulfur domain-containing protein n=1 Tax=Wolfiporia cocos (strain MD-104) TaxID=742152 RepID=A0A2H3JF18_WOLCO|nr:aconitase iron-sulfur domain-containing protein [Wolfiporia cocos MD-104 SS10]
MGAEVGATMSTFPYTPDMRAYLTATGRAPNLSELEPTINGPFTPDLATPLSNFGAFVKEQGWKDELSAGLIGSCTNSSYKDMTSVADLAKQAKAAGLTVKWKREDKKDEENAILTSFNHNFKPRNDGNTLPTPSGVPSKFTPPKGQDMPTAGFAPGETAFCPRPTSSPQPDTEVVIRPDSQRLERLEPFPSHFGEGSGNPRGLELPPLKKQGILSLWFADKADFSRIGSGDVIETIGLADILNGTLNATIKLNYKVARRNGEVFEIPTEHTMSSDQLK